MKRITTVTIEDFMKNGCGNNGCWIVDQHGNGPNRVCACPRDAIGRVLTKRYLDTQSLLSCCVPWLEQYQWHLEDIDVAGERNSELDALLAELKEVKHEK